MMKKSLVALAALAVVGVASAQSSVTLYGVLDIGFGKVKGGKFGLNNGEGYGQPATGAAGTTQIRDGFNSTSVIGFRGSEDLGGGLKANFNLQSGGLDLASGAAPVAFSREAWVGLEGGFGSVQMGRSSSVAAKTMGGYDLNGTSYSSALDRAGVSAVTWYGSSRRSDQLQYATPNMGGFQGRLGLTLKGDKGANNGGLGVAATAKDSLSLGLGFANGPLSIGGVYESKGTTANRNAFALGAAFDFGVAKVSATYNKREATGAVGANTMATPAAGGKGASIGVVAPIGAFYIGTQYAKNSDTNAKALELFAGYNLSKRTKLYADYVRVSGVNAVPAPAAATVTANGLSAIPSNPTAFGIGVVHTF